MLLCTTALAVDTVASGTCGAEGDGSNLTWTLDSEGTLTISGQGAMADDSPWWNDRTAIKTVNICDGVTSIGSSAFDDCSKLTSVTIPAGVTAIGSSAFFGCSNLTDVTIPDGITSISDSVFCQCSSLASVTIPSSVTSIEGGAFQNCTSLTSVIIPVGVTAIGDHAFYSCSSLTNIIIPEGTTSIGDSAFSRCSSLTDVSIPGSVTIISSNAFSWCSSLTCINIPEGVIAIDGSAFDQCSGLTSVNIPSSVATIGDHAFSQCTNLTSVNITDMDAWCRIDFQGPNATPVYYANIYLNGKEIVSVDVPEGVSILNYTFCGFQNLVKVTLPVSMSVIGNCAFEDCSSLTSINLPTGISAIGTAAFWRCTNLKSIDIPAGVTSIGGSAFSECTSLTSVNIPEGVNTIQRYTFSRCSSLTNVNIPSSVTNIGENAFSGCSSLTSASIPNSVTRIHMGAFSGCNSLTSVNIPSSVTGIGESAFSGCTSLISVHISDITAWYRIYFNSRESNPLCYAERLYLNGMEVKTLNIPDGVKTISQYAFINASRIERVALPKSLKSVGAYAFDGCDKLIKVYYAGSENNWKELNISTGNWPLTQARRFYDSTLDDDYYYRITVKVSDGGRISVSANTTKAGETITVTATPYAGYQLDGIYVDGKRIEGNTFTVTGNHEVSAVFSLLPGGTEEYRLEGITVMTAAGEKVQELSAEKLLVSVSVRHMKESSGAVVMLAQYDTEGRYQGLLWLALDEMPLDMALKVTLPVDNSDGKIANLKVFVVSSILSPVPMGNAVSFGSV